MKTVMVPLAAFGLTALATGTASAAAPAYCALYAREYANQAVEAGASAGMTVKVENQAYYRCLNQDEDPAMPTASAYFGTDIGGEPIAQGDASQGDEVTVPADNQPKRVDNAAAARPAATRRQRGSLVAFSPEWVAKCQRYFPNSFDPDTGTVLPYHSGKRRPCPY